MHSIEDKNIKKAIERADELYHQRKQIMKLAPEQAMEKILEYRQPAALVHSFAEQDLYFLVHEIGPEDGLSLLALASKNQWEYILDMEIWKQDRISTQSMTRWLNLLLSADPKRTVQWLVSEQTELIEFYLHHSLNIIIREHDQDPSDFGEGYFTLDNTVYVRIADIGQEHETVQVDKELYHQFLNRFLAQLAQFDYDQYQKVILETIHILPAETEEEALRLRTVRLAEKGLLPSSEAVGIYQPMTPEEMEQKIGQMNLGLKGSEDAFLYRTRSPLSPSEAADGADIFSRSLKLSSLREILPRVQSEFASLCNQLISADRKAVQSKEQLKDVVKKACGYLSIGMEHLMKHRQGSGIKMTPDQMASMIEKYPLNWIFRAGYGCALRLKWKVQDWNRKSWYHAQGFGLTFWDEFCMGVLGGVLIKKPLFFDNYQTGVIYREFFSYSDIEKTSRVLDQIIDMDRLLSLMHFEDLLLASKRLLTYKNLLMTLWARNFLGLPEKAAPVSIEKFGPFFDKLFDEKPVSDVEDYRKIPVEMKTSFLNWLLDRSGLAFNEISRELGQILEELFQEIENEYAMVAQKDLDPRFVNLFLLE
ncbi:MAG: DUF6178 family protein [Desulfobacterales bacterium]